MTTRPAFRLVDNGAVALGTALSSNQGAGMKKDDQEDVLAEVTATPGRRVIGIGMLAALALLLLYVAVATPPALGWQIFLIALTIAALMVAQAMWKATQHTLQLTRTVLRDETGQVIVHMDDVASIDRGAFAFKPSNGFLLRLKKPYARDWRPGLWWRFSKRVGVGGMVPMRPTKFMAETIALILVERDGS